MRLIALLALVGLSAAPSMTLAAPANVLNKTITVSLTTSAPWVTAEGQKGVGTRHTTHTIYVSSAGRVFAKRVRQDGAASEVKGFAPGANTFRFVGDVLIGNATYVSGASEMIINFDPSGQSCTASVQYGRASGRAMSWKGVNGVTYTATGPWEASNVRCSVAAGNAFAE